MGRYAKRAKRAYIVSSYARFALCFRRAEIRKALMLSSQPQGPGPPQTGGQGPENSGAFAHGSPSQVTIQGNDQMGQNAIGRNHGHRTRDFAQAQWPQMLSGMRAYEGYFYIAPKSHVHVHELRLWRLKRPSVRLIGRPQRTKGAPLRATSSFCRLR